MMSLEALLSDLNSTFGVRFTWLEDSQILLRGMTGPDGLPLCQEDALASDGDNYIDGVHNALVVWLANRGWRVKWLGFSVLHQLFPIEGAFDAKPLAVGYED